MTDDREERCAPLPLPPALAGAVAGFAWARDRVGESGCAVYRLHGRPGAADLFLKHGQGACAHDVAEEAARLRWLSDRVPAPAVLHLAETPDEAWMLTTALPGITMYQALAAATPPERPAIVAAAAAFLRRLHALPVDHCPFDAGHAGRMRLARRRIDDGLVDEDDFDADRAGWTAEQVWQAMQRLLPLAADAVVTHGDFSPDNLLIEHGRVSGCIDVGRLGVAHRYQDLAIAWNALGEFGDDLRQGFLSHYGVTRPDRSLLDFHLLLDELF